MFRTLYYIAVFIMLSLFMAGCTVKNDAGFVSAEPGTVNQPAGSVTQTAAPPLVTPVTLIEFYAYWCPVCQQMHPTIEALEAQYGDTLSIVPYDIDDRANDAVKAQYEYRLQPYFVLLDARGNVVQTWQGFVDKDVLQGAIDGVLATQGN